MTATEKYHGQHRWRPGMIALQNVGIIWQREHPGLDPVENLGCRNYRPRHALVPPPRRTVHL